MIILYICTNNIIFHLKPQEMERLQAIICHVLMGLMSLTCMQKATAQTFEYPIYDDDSIRIEVKSKGASPTISDFATAILRHCKEEPFLDKMNEEWALYQQKRPLRHHGRFIVDTRNGFLSYTMPITEADETLTLEMCFWNCADGKHRLLGCNVTKKCGGDYCWSEFVGCSFYLYDNAQKTMRQLLPEDIGTLFDGQGLSVFFLPRKGKDIRVTVLSEDERWDEILKWNGYTFTTQE